MSSASALARARPRSSRSSSSTGAAPPRWGSRSAASISSATATTGPIAFVAFLAGPIAARIVGPGVPVIAPAALTGACLVMAADLIGQFAFDTKFPVGVITGILGAPYLIYLLTRTARRGGSA
ncbi:iron chelate uptake ABC transporter family permease subunit [Microbacterium lacticum]